ncbi:MAG: prepilin peptidase [Arcobacter sp.]|nr:prepilin peptidase [Arcobacter sp.]|tara:strand:+ start:1840 stop:3801 length:1962 start_codon:yes stop_codon:yes gene_type:complete
MREYRKQIQVSKEKKLYSGIDSLSNYFIGKIKNLQVNHKSLKKEAEKIYKLSIDYSSISDEELDEKVRFYHSKFKINKVNDNEFINALGIVVELAYRQLGKRAYVVQIMGTISLIRGFAIEMSTGEGKTITASIAAVILAWRGKPVHILTSNDYLASRDAEILKDLYNKANLSVGSIIGSSEKEYRKETYKKDIVYTTGKEVLADFLKDRMLEEENFCVNSFLIDKISNKNISNDYLLRGLDVVIVDEADSVLADDAVTPLIISAKAENKVLQESVVVAYNIAKKLKKDVHYKIYEKFHDIVLLKEAIKEIESNSDALINIWRLKERREFLIKQALIARELYHNNKDYIIKDGKVVIIDEKTGRVMSERSWSNGLHQAIEVKEGLEVTEPTITYAKMSFQRFFRLYKHLCGMSGTIQNLKDEFWQIYSLKTIKIPTRVPSKMNILSDRLHLNKVERDVNLVEYIKDLNKKNIPVLVGVTTIKDSEFLALKLKEFNIECTLLNALHDEQEAEIISKAGRLKNVTIATNMAGRGTDIHIEDKVNGLGGLHVITLQRDVSRRIDLQFFGRCARQGQNGTAMSFLSLDDKIVQQYLPKWLRIYLGEYFNFSIIRKIALYMYIYYQYRIEKDISKLRNKTLFKDMAIEDSMSFTKVNK